METLLRCAYVPKNNKGIEDCELMEFDSSDIEEYAIEDDEFQILKSAGVFSAINKRCGVLIEDYEEEIVKGPDVKTSLEVLKTIDPSHKYNFTKAMLAADNYNTRVDIYF